MWPQIDTDKDRSGRRRLVRPNMNRTIFSSVFICVHLWQILLFGGKHRKFSTQKKIGKTPDLFQTGLPIFVEYFAPQLLLTEDDSLTARLNVVPFSSFRLPPVSDNVEPPCADADPDCEMLSPLSEPVVAPTVDPAEFTTEPVVWPTAFTTFPVVWAVVLTAPPTVFPTPPSNPPPDDDDEDEVVVLDDDEAYVSACVSSPYDADARA